MNNIIAKIFATKKEEKSLTVMTDTDCRQLELLLGKLSTELNTFRVGIFNGHFMDGYHLGCYNQEGKLKNETGAPSIKQAIFNIKFPTPNA